MINPQKRSLSRRPFVSMPGVKTGRCSAGRRTCEIRWARALHGPLPVPRAVEGRVLREKGAGARQLSVRRARSFLFSRADLLGIHDPGDLDFVRRWRSRSGTHIRFQQLFRGIPVIGALLDVHLDRRGEVYMVCGAFYRQAKGLLPSGGRPAITRKNAVSRALDDLGRGCTMRAELKVDELIQPGRKGFRLLYKVVLPAARPLGNWVYLINPYTGVIIHSYNTMRFARGKGRIYLTNPLEDPALHLKPLLRMNAQSALQGKYVDVINEDYPEAKSSSGSFLYKPDNTHFDEVMVYYHVDRISERYRRLDPSLDNVMGGARCIRAFVHVGEAMDNAYYDPATNGLYFGDGGGAGGMNDLAKEAAVLYHEYTHAVLDHINPHMKGSEADALHEGYADYYGCALTGDAQIGEWAVAPRGRPHLRDLTNRKRYPEDLLGEAHDDGEIWAGACWDLLTSLGRERSDSLVYESMHFLPEFARFSDAAVGIVQADETVFSGQHAALIRKIMDERGLPLGNGKK